MRQFHKLMTVFLSITLMFSGFSVPAYAEEASVPTITSGTSDSGVSNATEENNGTVVDPLLEPTLEPASVSTDTASQSTTIVKINEIAADYVEYIYIESPILSLGSQENIVVGFLDESVNISSATLVYKNLTTGDSLTCSASNIMGSIIHFAPTFNNVAQVGTYQLIDIEYTLGGTETGIHSVDLTQDPEQYNFIVANGINGGSGETGSDKETTAYTITEQGTLTEASSLQDAISQNPVSPNNESSLAISSFAASSFAAPQEGSGTLVVALDPGHGGSDPGATGYGLQEKTLNLKIAQYCKTELEQYTGVSVFMTRTTDEYVGLTERVESAVNAGASVFVSIHNNAGGGTGAEVFIPNDSSYNHQTYVTGEQLASKILNNITALGLANRGIKVRDSEYYAGEGPFYYPDGHLADFYTVISTARDYNLTGIIVEHAFVDSASNAAFLSSEANLQALGIADATGIASQYGLSKWTWNASVSALVSPDKKTAKITVSPDNEPVGITSVSVPVWGEANGQNDLVWYSATKQDGSWTVEVPIERHGEVGLYYADVYAIKNGPQQSVGSTSFNIDAPSVTVDIVTVSDGKFDVVINASSPAGIQSVQVPVWSDVGGKDDIVWYAAAKQSGDSYGGTYKVSVSAENHKYSGGTYNVHAYVLAGNGTTRGVAKTATVSVPAMTLTATPSSDQKTVVVRAAGSYLPNATSVAFPVWSDVGGQDDIVWYTAVKQTDSSWTVEVPVSKHGSSGLYNVHMYATISGQTVTATTTFNIDAPSVTVDIVTVSDGKFDVVINASSPAGIQSVQVPVWSDVGGKDDIVWYAAAKQSGDSYGGTYKVSVSAENHKYSGGTYNVHAYVLAGNGTTRGVAKTATVSVPAMTLTATPSSDQKTVVVRAAGSYLPNATSVAFPVWSDVGGQDDIVWYTAVKQTDSSWTVEVPVSKHGSSGLYNVHMYATISGQTVTATTTFNIDAPSVTVDIVTVSDGKFDVVINASSPAGIQSVQVPVWSDVGGKDDIVWYAAAKQSGDSYGGTYKVSVSAENHKYSGGTYNVHAYVLAGNGTTRGVAKTATVSVPAMTLTATPSSDQKTVVVRAAGSYLPNATSVAFPVWSDVGGQDDIVWYTAVKQTDSSWTVEVPVSKHGSSGLYNVHMYATISGQTVTATTTFNIDAPSVTVDIVTVSDGKFDVVINASSPAGIQSVQVPVWSDVGGKDDIVWYAAAKQSGDSYGGTYKVSVSAENHKYSGGTYNVHAYVLAGNGTTRGVAKTTTVSGGYAIMGASGTTVDSMVALYNSKGKVYPSIVYSQYGAATIRDFCSILLEEANAEGVKAEVVFAQAMHETGWLQFGGDVQVEQCNFAGLGATGGVPGLSFNDWGANSVRKGIRAQVQHLKAYASTAPLSNECVDPRFNYVTRGIAPTVEELGAKWAPSTSYGTKILEIINTVVI